jgi:hypothetical protein
MSAINKVIIYGKWLAHIYVVLYGQSKHSAFFNESHVLAAIPFRNVRYTCGYPQALPGRSLPKKEWKKVYVMVQGY